jgi:hypothetical protein
MIYLQILHLTNPSEIGLFFEIILFIFIFGVSDIFLRFIIKLYNTDIRLSMIKMADDYGHDP